MGSASPWWRLSKVHLALIALFGGALGTSVVPLFVRLSEVGPSSTAFHRTLMALPFLWIWMIWERNNNRKQSGKKRRALRTPDILRFAIAGFAFTGDLSLWHRSILNTSIANASFLGYMSPVFVALLAWLLFRQKISRLFILGLAICILGAGLLMGSAITLNPEGLGGDLMALTAALFYAIYLLFLGRSRAGFSTAVTMFWITLFTCIGLLFVALTAGETMWPHSIDGWLILGGLTLCAQLLGLGLITFAFAHLPSSFASVALFSQPVLSVLVARLFIHEPTDFQQIAGCAIVLIGIYVARRGSSLS